MPGEDGAERHDGDVQAGHRRDPGADIGDTAHIGVPKTIPRGEGDERIGIVHRFEMVDQAGEPDSVSSHPVIENGRSDEHTSELQSLMRTSYAVFCLKQEITKSPPHATTKKYTHSDGSNAIRRHIHRTT